MKITREYGTTYITFTEDFFITIINEWSQFSLKYNWYTFTPVQISFENDIMTGGLEFTVIILGLGFMVRYNHKPEILEKMAKRVDEYIKNK